MKQTLMGLFLALAIRGKGQDKDTTKVIMLYSDTIVLSVKRHLSNGQEYDMPIDGTFDVHWQKGYKVIKGNRVIYLNNSKEPLPRSRCVWMCKDIAQYNGKSAYMTP
jgi:hypothetical protein